VVRVRRLSGAVAVLAVVAGGCGDDGDAAGGAVEPEADAADDGSGEDAADDGSGEDAAGGTEVDVGATDLGDVLVAGDGMTLYVFDPDEQGASTCYDECEAAWPPLIADGEPVAGGDVQADLLGTAEREGGELQVTYDGWPLYRWASDQAPGDTTGQGVQDVWWVITPDAEPVRESAATEPAGSTEETDTSGY
jgi:predicted lipoprotein with Yx(FWY)xxD motif